MIKSLLIAASIFTSGIAAKAADQTPVTHDSMSKGNTKLGERPWQRPSYDNQREALGWTPTAFAVPAGLQTQYKFWLDIYTKYSTDQGVLHDSEYIDFVYQELDFNSIENDKSLDAFQKERARDRMVRNAKKEVVDRLEKLQKLKSSKGLQGEDLRVWNMFANVEEKNKFVKAADKGRLRFQLGQSDRFVQGIYYSGRYIQDFEQIAVREGLPKELVRITFVESSFNIFAQSKVGASGLMQIMPAVGKEMLTMNAAIDERNHPWVAMKAAAKILKKNFQMLEDWSLAMTGYNHGAYGIRRLVKKHKVNNIAELVQNAEAKGSFGFASRNFYASFLAALEADRNADKYYGKVMWSDPLPKTEFKLETAISYDELLKWFGGDETLARLFNPHITYDARKGRVPIPAKSSIYVHNNFADLARAEMKSFAQQKRKLYKSRQYRVSRGDTLIGIAKKFGVPVKVILANNDIDRKNHIRIGQLLSIPHAN